MKKKNEKAPRFDSQAYWDDFEKRYLRGEMKTIPNFEKVKKMLQRAARAKLEEIERTKLVSIRVRERDLARLRAKAKREGLPYQTLINSLIHKYAEGKRL